MAFEQNQFHACRISEAMRFAPEQTQRRPWTSMWLRPPSGVYAFMYLLAGMYLSFSYALYISECVVQMMNTTPILILFRLLEF